MTEQLTNPYQRPLCDLITDDSSEISCQTTGHRRTSLLQYTGVLAANQAEVEAVKLNHTAQLAGSQGERNE